MENTQNTLPEENISPIIIDEQKLPENKEEEPKATGDKKFIKINLPKRKYAIIHGYNGYNYSGNQKNPDVKTVEEEMERTFYNMKLISECNYGTLQKISWMRASRTDKKVSAIMNLVSCKLHKYPGMDEAELKAEANKLLPSDVKIFRFIEVSNSFDSKDSNNNREYHYILPSFMLEPKDLNDLESRKGIDTYSAKYDYKITPEYHEKIKAVCKFFKGSKKYHNYTKKLSYNDASSVRHIYEFSCDELINFESFQAVKFKIVGQSFLYNQIRKMIGGVIDVCRGMRDMTYLENSMLANRIDIPKAPAEGLYLFRIDYSRYNDRKGTKKNPIFLTESDEKEMDDFRVDLIKHIQAMEIKEKSFTKWLWKFDNMKENIY